MESKILEFTECLSSYDIRKGYLRGFELFEEFSGRSIYETIKRRRENFNIFNSRVKGQLEREVESFYNWLKEVKGLQPSIAYYYSVGLKSLLAGLPMGVTVGLLFGIILDTHAGQSLP